MTDSERLRQIPYFQSLSAADLGALGRRCQPRLFHKGETIFHEGERCEGLWVVAEGRVKIFRVSAGGREQVLHTEGPGATLGEVPLFDGGGYVASAAALGLARLLWLRRADVEALCRRRPQAALAIIATMAGRVRAFAALAGDLSLRPVYDRLARLLLAEARRSGRRTPEGVEITLPGTRDDIAALIGTVREIIPNFLIKLLKFTDWKTSLPFTVDIFDTDDQKLLTIKRGFTIFRSRVDVLDGHGRKIGSYQQRLLSIGGKLEVFDAADQSIAMLLGDWKGWDFTFSDKQGRTLAKVTKKWAGLGKELFTTADQYVVDVSPEVTDPTVKKLVLAAAFCVDMVFKEKGR